MLARIVSPHAAPMLQGIWAFLGWGITRMTRNRRSITTFGFKQLIVWGIVGVAGIGYPWLPLLSGALMLISVFAIINSLKWG